MMTLRRLFRRLASAVILGAAWPATPSEASPPVPVIFDTDMDSDCDDPAALRMLHALADRGEAIILATVVSSQTKGSAECTDAINAYFGRPDLPIGGPVGKSVDQRSKYAASIAAQYPGRLKAGTKRLENATELYLRILRGRPDRSVVVVTVGDLTNLARLLRHPDGPATVRAKVKRWVCMGGNFVGRPAHDDLKLSNNNFTLDPESSVYAVRNWPAPIVFVGREIGSVPSGLKAGRKLEALPESNPVRLAYRLYFDGQIRDRHVADQATVLYAVRGPADYWDVETRGYMDLLPDCTFTWRYDENRGHGYVLKKPADADAADRRIERIIEELMCRPPKSPADGLRSP